MSGYKNCPYCDEEIKEIAVKCRYCKSMLIGENKQDLKEEAFVGQQSNKTKDVKVPDYQPPSSKKNYYGLIAVLFLAIILILFGAIFMVGLLDVNDIYAFLGSEQSVEYSEVVT